MRSRTLLLVGLFMLAQCGAAFADGRAALVIGNFEYQFVPKLVNAQNDARATAALLREEKFEVDEHHNVGNSELRRVVRSFFSKTRDADIAVVFFAGHGIEVDGSNYLIPVDARLRTDLDVEDEAVSLDRIMQVLEPARRLRLVILDACRDNPFVTSMKRTTTTRAVTRGLAKVEPSKPDTLIAFAAKAGSVAEDGKGDHSPFTRALLKHIAEPGLDIRLALGRVRDEVIASTQSTQEPFVYGSLGGSVITLSAKGAAQAAQNTVALADFEIARKLGTVEAWDAYLARHKQGYVSDLAKLERERLAALSGDAAVARDKPSVPDTPVSEQMPLTFEPDDRTRVAAIATRHKLPLPDYSLKAPSSDLPENLRNFIGVWASVVGFHGSSTQAMIIVTEASETGKVDGHFVIGPPPKGSRFPFPARALPIKGVVTGDRLLFATPRASMEAELTAQKTLELKVSQNGGRHLQVQLKPVWRVVERHSFALAPAEPKATRSNPAPSAAAPRTVSAPSQSPDLNSGTGGGARRGVSRGDGDSIVNSPRFPMCARQASQRGLTQPGPERRRFVRNCVLSG